MALFEKQTRQTLLGMGIGAGAVLALSYVGPVLAAISRPLVKALVAKSMDGFEAAMEGLASAAESFQDLVAEARAERAARDLPVAAAATSEVHPAPGGSAGVN